jgi:hypothetical protein
MKAAGPLLMFAGFVIVAAALVLLSSSAARGAFVLAGLLIQLFGLFLAFRAHYTLDEGSR